METAEHDAATARALVLGRYALLDELGSGGFGAVWLARDERLERLVAVKRIPVAGAAAAARAEKEALAAARLSHPAVVSLYEAGRDHGAVHLVTELVRGHNLGDLLHDGALSDRDVVLIGMAMCDALAHAHSRGVIHRDVKPGNVLVPESAGEGVVAKLTDFGIARIAGDDALTATGDVVGTLAYMAPEQAEGRGATAASDLYSLGLVLYEAFCGVNPVRGANAAATSRNIGMRIPPLHRMRRDLTRALCAAIDATLLYDPALRGSPDSLRLALSESLHDVGDEPGTIEAPWAAEATQYVAKTAQAWRRRVPRAPEPEPAWEEDPDADHRPRWAPAVPIPARILSGLTAAAAITATLSLAETRPPIETPLAGALVAATVALLPRIGWIAAMTAALAWAGAHGEADWWMVAVAAAPAIVLLPLRPAWWPSPAIAVGLGWIGAAAAWPAVAGTARTLSSRAVLGAAGFWAAAVIGTLIGKNLVIAPAASIEDLIRDPAMAIAAVWAGAAAVLPFVVRGRNVGVDLLAAVLWATALAVGHEAAGGVTVAGPAALAALLAVLGGALRRT